MKNMCGSTSDIISDLPDDIIEKILVLLPMRDAVRTTVLSKKWRVVCLELREVIITADTFQSIVSSCPVLEQLTFESSKSFDFIGIDAPNLKVLSLMGTLKSLNVKNAPLLANFSIHSKASVWVLGRGRDKFDWVGLLDGLPVLKNLHMGDQYLKSLKSLGKAGSLGKKLPALQNLNILELSDVWLGHPGVVWSILVLIKISPKLHKVIIQPITKGDVYEAAALEYCELITSSLKFHLNHPREVELCLVSGTTIELHFMKLLLAKS